MLYLAYALMSNGLLINCIAHYALDEVGTTGDRIEDINGYDFSLATPVQLDEPGKIGRATVTATPADLALLTPVPADFIFGSGQSFTLGGWMQVRTAGRNNVIMSQWDNTIGGSAFLFFGFAAIPRFRLSNDGDPGNITTLDANLSMATNTWYHLFAVYDGAAQTMSLFTSTEAAFNVSPNTPVSHIGGAFNGATNRLTFLGVDFNGGVQDSDGRFDEIAVWRRALSAADVEVHWNGGAGLPFNQWDGIAPGGDGGAAYNYYYRQMAG